MKRAYNILRKCYILLLKNIIFSIICLYVCTFCLKSIDLRIDQYQLINNILKKFMKIVIVSLGELVIRWCFKIQFKKSIGTSLFTLLHFYFIFSLFHFFNYLLLPLMNIVNITALILTKHRADSYKDIETQPFSPIDTRFPYQL